MFFFKQKSRNGPMKLDQRKRKREDKVSKKNEEISSDEDDLLQKEKHSDILSDGDDNETAQEKKLRLAKVYLEEIEREERRRLEVEEIDKDVISQRLKDDHLKETGRFEMKLSEKIINVNEKRTKFLKCKEQRNTITCLCITSDDEWLFSSSKDGVIVKWSLKHQKKIGVIPFCKVNLDRIIGHNSCINALAISTDKKFLAAGDKTGMIQIWDPHTLKHIQTLKGHLKSVTGLIFRQNSHILYSCSEDQSVRVWSLDEMAFVETLFGHQGFITSIDVLHNERPITAGGSDHTIRLWKITEDSQLIFNVPSGNVDCVKLINDNYFISGGDDGQICIWSCLKKKPINCIKAAHGCNPNNSQPYWISSVGSLPFTDVVASGSEDGYIRIWALKDKYRTIDKLFQVPANGIVNSLIFTSDCRYLIAGLSRDYRLGRWSVVKSAKNGILLIPLLRKE